MITTYLL